MLKGYGITLKKYIYIYIMQDAFHKCTFYFILSDLHCQLCFSVSVFFYLCSVICENHDTNFVFSNSRHGHNAYHTLMLQSNCKHDCKTVFYFLSFFFISLLKRLKTHWILQVVHLFVNQVKPFKQLSLPLDCIRNTK